MALWQWSTTPANNASAGLIDWAEGQPPSTVNDSARQMMADVAEWFNAPAWLVYGLVPTFVNGTKFTTPNDETAVYSVGRRVRATVSAGTIFGTVTASVFSSLTTVTVTWDSGALDNGVSAVDVGLLNPAVPSFPSGYTASFAGLTVTGNSIFLGKGNASELDIQLNNSNTDGNIFLNTAGVLGFFDISRNITRFTSDASGNFIAAGNLTSSSDERLKTEWKPLATDFLEQLATLKRGTYTRTDSGQRQVGVSAQSLQVFLPEAVQGEEMLSVAYGQAALVACAELAAEVLRLRALLEPVK
jgi:hypothetical protein